MELVKQCGVLRASSFQRTVICIQNGNNFYSLTSGLRPNGQQKLADSRMPLLSSILSLRLFLNEALWKQGIQSCTALVKILNPYPPSSEYLCAKDRMSDARPLPSQITTGRGGSSRRHSKTMEITLGPPSTMSPTTGTPCPSPAKTRRTETRKKRSVIET